MNVATSPAYATAPVTAAPPVTASVKVVALNVPEAIGSLKVALNTWPTGTFGAPFAGTVDTTIGTIGGAATVVKVHTKLPSSSAPPGLAAPLVTVAV